MGVGGVKVGALEGSAAQDRMLLVLAAIGFLYILRLVYLVVPWFYGYFLRPAKDLRRSPLLLLHLQPRPNRIIVINRPLFSPS